jgi:ElaB/YqjD/DUF883 family membrane-anchored ribosome-binding protein
MGFDITGLNPKNIEINEPERPDNLFELSQKEQDKYFEKREKFINQSGVYFRNNVWWWRPLAEYVLKHTKVIPEHEQESWQYNDCTEVSKQNAEMIAQQLDYLIKSGHTKQFEKEYEKIRKKIEKHNEKVEKELETFSQSVKKKMRNDNLAPKDFPKEDYKKWEKIYNKRNSSGSYPFSEENVKEFSEFCKNCGGFTIG